jgi:hypothetical protein
VKGVEETVRESGFPMKSLVDIEARTVLVDRLTGVRRDVVAVVRYLECCPMPVDPPVVPVLLAACDCIDEAIARLGGSAETSTRGPPAATATSATLDEPVDDRQ